MTKTKITFYFSIFTVFLAALGALGLNIWLASTQWMIIGVVLGVWAIYLKEE